MSDLGTFSIRVVDERGYPVRGATVMCAHGSGVSKEYTNDDGWAEFGIYRSSFLAGGFTTVRNVWVNGTEVSDGFNPEDGDTFSFTLPE